VAMNYSKLTITARRFKPGELSKILLSLRVVLTFNGVAMTITYEFSDVLSFACINSKELASEIEVK
jgi:hypothetical protein